MNRTKPLFKSIHSHPATIITIDDARDAYHACKKIINTKKRMQCYEAFGVDGEAIEKYLLIVENFNHLWEKNEHFERFLKSKYFKIGPFHIYISI